MVPPMRSVFHHLSATLGLLILAMGLLLASAVGANAHPPMHGGADALSALELQVPAPDRAAACTSPSCLSDHAVGCCHTTGAGCSTVHAICAAETDFVLATLALSPAIPCSAPGLNGRITPVAQRPPATLA